MSITEHFNYNNCECPPECDTLSEFSWWLISKVKAKLYINLSNTIWFCSIWTVSRHKHVEKRCHDDQFDDQPRFRSAIFHWNRRIYWWYGNFTRPCFHSGCFETQNYFQLFSDIGGAAGLILGMSFSTIVSILDWFISMLARFIHLQIQRCLNKL